MKDYFLAFEYYNRDINKFYFGVVTIDFTKRTLMDVASEIIDEKHGKISSDMTIKVTAFNNIEL